MNDFQLTTRRELELMQQLQQLADSRAAEEARITSARSEALMVAEKDHQKTADRITKTFGERRRSLENDFAEAKLAAGQELRDARQEITAQFEAETSRTATDHKQHLLVLERKHKEKQWEAMAVFDASKDGPRQTLEQAIKRIDNRKTQIDSLERDAATLLSMRRLTHYADTSPTKPSIDIATPSSLEKAYQDRLNELHKAVVDMYEQKLPPLLLEGHRVYGWLASVIVAMIVPAMFITDFSPVWTAVVAMLSGSALTLVAYFILRPHAIRQSVEQYAKIRAFVQSARELDEAARKDAQNRSRLEAEAIHQRKEQEVAAVQDTRDKALAESHAKKDELLALAQQRRDAKIAESQARHQGVLAAAEEKYPPLLDQLAVDRQTDWQSNEDRYAERTSSANAEHESAWVALASRWRTGFEQVTAELAAMRTACEKLFPEWAHTEWNDWQRPGVVPPVIPFGQCTLPLHAVKNGVSHDARLVPERTELQLPAWLSLTEHPRMVITADGAGRQAAGDVLQLMMFRFLTSVPAGRLRFTIIDPSALGQNFAPFMHLADFDEQLVGKRIWTDSRQVEERLVLLSDHMEKVLQKYLRNEFASIHEYNIHAGEVAEPLHVLVVANFPTGLSDNSMRRIKTIAMAGPRCGVYTLMSVDTSLRLPSDFNLQELLSGAVHLDWADDRLRWKYPLFEKLALQVAKLPAKDKLNEVLRLAAEESRVASRVEVPFAVVAPHSNRLWTESTADELVVPIGRAGANELQTVRLGKGTAQHALVSGKTGSGKSTLLHAIITNLALRYSPRELELYLVDFKKGVEFKTYATYQLPHARVIGIESEREFGVSVLERLDEVLRLRAERFRASGAQDLASFRRESNEVLPRILLVVDEFQELFVADDKLAQDAALLLDRLVRQGRAFGVHVVLGSQTLAGAYSLARSTIGQMAVRIALECSEADAHLILSDDNPAARLLSRPGEAIYNDQNGMVEGNHLFQVVWLPDHDRQQYLAQIRDRLVPEGIDVEPAIVFEGNVSANPLQNEKLTKLLSEDSESFVIEPSVWLGSEVRIAPPTPLTFRRQGGNNLLIVGQEEPLALGILTTAVTALVTQCSNAMAQIAVLDGMRSESPDRGAWQKLAEALSSNISVYTSRDTLNVINQLADEVARRGGLPDEKHEPRFLIVYDLAQIRDLRLTEEEFSFSNSYKNGNVPSIDKRFREILREGPAVGIHTLMWCDSHNSLMRVFDRSTLREVDFRVALRMSPVDSTNLIDSPAAGRLGEHRAIFYRDDTGTHTKFRPYGRPSAEFLALVTRYFRKAARTNGD